MDEDEPISHFDRLRRGSVADTDLDESGWLTRQRLLRLAIVAGLVMFGYPVWSAVLGWLGLAPPEEVRVVALVAVMVAGVVLVVAWSLKRWRAWNR